MTPAEIQQATRAELCAYLEAWGFQWYEEETTEDLRAAALENCQTEGA